MISNVALLGRPLLVNIICFLVRSGIVLFIPLFAIYGVVFRGEDWSGV